MIRYKKDKLCCFYPFLGVFLHRKKKLKDNTPYTIMRKILYVLWVIMAIMPLRGMAADDIRLSLLTCAPGSEIYALFGHSAIRYENLSSKQDWVFNYGMFSFREPNFVMRFVKGETDYQLGVVPYSYFEAEYAERGSAVYQQVLNLTEEEKLKLVRALQENYLPANRKYRYNYFYDNCTTRARDKVEECIEGKIVYTKSEKEATFRSIIHEYTKGSDWSEFGIDLCLGAEADKPIEFRQQMFAPFYMLEAAGTAMVQRGDTLVPLVKEEFKVVDVVGDFEPAFPLSPMVCAMGLLVITLCIVARGVRKGHISCLWDVFLFGLQGIGGCLIAFLFFFSVHPTVGSNWMIVWLNPIPLFYLPFMVYKALKRKKDTYHWINSVYLTSFILLMPLIPQEFNLTVLPLALSLLATSVGHLFIYKRNHQ